MGLSKKTFSGCAIWYYSRTLCVFASVVSLSLLTCFLVEILYLKVQHVTSCTTFPSHLKVRYKPTKAGYITALPREVVFFGRVMTSVRRNCEGELPLCIVSLSYRRQS